MKLFTTNTEKRWVGIATILSFFVTLSLPLLVALDSYGVVTLSSVPQGWFFLYSLVVITAVVWTFGENTVNAAKEILDGDK